MDGQAQRAAMEARLRSALRLALLDPNDNWADPVVQIAASLIARTYRDLFDEKIPTATAREIAASVRELLEKSDRTAQSNTAEANLLAAGTASFITHSLMSAGTGSGWQKEWVTMGDDKVRESHRAAALQGPIPATAKFDVGGHAMDVPGDVTAPIEEWANCRCHPNYTRREDADSLVAAATDTAGDSMSEQPVIADEPIDLNGEYLWEEIPLYGVLAPEDVKTGDKRKFLVDSLAHVEPPLSLRWQEVDMPGHDGSVVTGHIDKIWREDGLIKWEGGASMSDAADKMVALIAEKSLRGISVDLDDTEVELQNADGTDGTLDEPRIEIDPDTGEEIEVLAEIDVAGAVMAVSKGRIRSAAAVAIPAFIEAFIAIGTWADHDKANPKTGDAPEVTDEVIATAAAEVEEFASISDKPWDGSASRFTPEQWYASCILHRSTDKTVKSDHSLPIKEPGGALSRAGVHAAASRIGQVDATPEQKAKAKAALRGAYAQLGEEPPESIAASADTDTFGITSNPTTQDGPGWLTHPVDTDRLRDYWVRGAGAAKIGWGAPGDFNRCRALLAPYVKERFLAGYCANRHKDALGIWPGEHRGGALAASAARAQRDHPDQIAPAWNILPDEDDVEALVASGNPTLLRPPRWWFDEPPLEDQGPMVVTEEGRVYGLAAEWDTCHVGFANECVTAPHSPSNYARFRLGDKITDEGNVPIGVITIGTGHAPLSMDAFHAAAHYDNTGTVVAQIAIGESAKGIWVAGCVAPSATPEQVDDLRASKLSGDWREFDRSRQLDMLRVLAVNTPGFAVPRMALAASANGEEYRTALVAAGMVESSDERIQRVVKAAVADTLAEMDRKQVMRGIEQNVYARRKAQIAALAARRKG